MAKEAERRRQKEREVCEEEMKAQKVRKDEERSKQEVGKERRLREVREEGKKTWRESEEEEERKELEEREMKLEEDKKEAESWMEKIRRQLQQTRSRLKEMGMGFGPKETDTIAAARSDDEDAAITTNDAEAAGSAIATEASRVQRGVVEEDGRSKAESDEASRCEVAHRKKTVVALERFTWTERSDPKVGGTDERNEPKGREGLDLRKWWV